MSIQEILTNIAHITNNYLAHVPKEQRKALGQFFTSPETASFMASLISPISDSVSILDPGCGNGMLSAAAVSILLSSASPPSKISLTLFENDAKIIPVLNESLNYIHDLCLAHDVTVEIRLRQENFIAYYADSWRSKTAAESFDIIICNPPYKKIRKQSSDALVMSDVVYGQPNLYALFMALSAFLLRPTGQMVFITPRSWTSGLYFKTVRSYILDTVNIENIHLFLSRDKVFRTDNILQETMILKASKTARPKESTLIVSTSTACDCHIVNTFFVPQESCVSRDKNQFLLVPSSSEEVAALNLLSSFTDTFFSSGYRFKTGQVVEFRVRSALRRNRDSASCIPLLHTCNIKDGCVYFDIETDRPRFLSCANPAYAMQAKDSIFIKRFTAKEETRRLQPALFERSRFPDIKTLSLENHLNYLVKNSGDLSKYELYGIFVLLSSSVWDNYYRVLNGSTQVNAEELNSMPIPPSSDIIELGRRAVNALIADGAFESDKIIKEYLSYV